MLRGTSTKALYEQRGPRGFVSAAFKALGLTDRDDPRHRHRDRAGNQTLRRPRDRAGNELDPLRPEDFSFRDLAESIIGEDWNEQLNPGALQRVAIMEANGVNLLETGGTGALSASAFANINAFTAVVAGLLEVKVMEGWQNPQYIAEQLMPAEATKMFDGRKVIGVSRIGDQAEERLPLMPTKRVQIGERWIQQPRTVENALSSEVSQEVVYLDLTGQALSEASDVGTWLGYRKELRCIDAFIGVTNTYSYKGTSYNTYQAAGTWDNSFSNELLHWTDIEEVEIKFRDMTDPETGTRVLIQPNTILVNRGKLHTANAIIGATNVQYRDATSAAHNIREFANPIKGYSVLESPLVYERCRASDGLNLSAANAEKYWWTYEKGKPFKYAQNWPLRTQQAAPNQLDMIDRGVVLYIKADERGIPMVYEPRRVVRCTN